MQTVVMARSTDGSLHTRAEGLPVRRPTRVAINCSRHPTNSAVFSRPRARFSIARIARLSPVNKSLRPLFTRIAKSWLSPLSSSRFCFCAAAFKGSRNSYFFLARFDHI